MTALPRPELAAIGACRACGTELPPGALACPACRALVHGEALKSLAADAQRLTDAGALADASAAWQRMLELLPAGSGQARAVRDRITELTRRLAERPASAKGAAVKDERPWYRRGIAGVGALLLVLLGKLKFLLLGLTKASTFFSMFAFLGVYWTMYGWALALGLVLSIYIHEMGHVSTLRRLGIAAGAPLFIPGLGALVLLKQHVDDPMVDARIGLAGPLWGLGAGLAAYAAYVATGSGVWAAIAALTGLINLFNLIPVWQLDGSRGFHALNALERWVVVGSIGAAYFATGQRLLLLIGLVAAWRAFQRPAGPGDRRTLLTFVVLVAALSWLAGVH